ncbi:MAG: LCP family protein [Acidimicrobiales bacterium]
MAEQDAVGRRVLGRSSSDGPVLAPGSAHSVGRPVLGNSANAFFQNGLPEVASNQQLEGSDRLKRKTRFRFSLRLLVVTLIALLVLIPAGTLLIGWWRFSRLPTVDVSAALSERGSRQGMNYLIVGTDSRAGINSEDPNAGAFLTGESSGARTDTIMVLHVDGARTQLVSIPRDLWISDPATGQMGRINATYAGGQSNLIRAVESIGIPVDQYLEINFVSFGKLVDSVGGITIDFPHPAKDENSGLAVPSSGPQLLDGAEALAYVRSRYYTELIDGKWRIDGTADIGRAERQRVFFTALMTKVSNERNPFQLISMPGSLGSGMKRGSTFTFLDALGLAWSMKDASPQPVALAVSPRRTSGGAEVLDLQPESKILISELAS